MGDDEPMLGRAAPKSRAMSSQRASSRTRLPYSCGTALQFRRIGGDCRHVAMRRAHRSHFEMIECRFGVAASGFRSTIGAVLLALVALLSSSPAVACIDFGITES